MRRFVLILLCIATSGCGAVRHELRHPGGYTGYLLDDRMFDASHSKQMQLFRTALIISMAARMAPLTVKDGEDADAYATYLGAAADELNYAAVHLYRSDKGTAPCAMSDPEIARVSSDSNQAAIAHLKTTCRGFYANFESELAVMDERTFRLVLASLPQQYVKEFVEDAASGNMMGAAWSALRAMGQAAPAMRRAAAVWRSGMEHVAVLRNSRCANNRAYVEDADTGWHAVECIGLQHNRFGSNPEDKLGPTLTYDIDPVHFMSVLRLAQAACVQLPLTETVTEDGQLKSSREDRRDVCAKVDFNPRARPFEIVLAGSQTGTTEAATQVNVQAPVEQPEASSDGTSDAT